MLPTQVKLWQDIGKVAPSLAKQLAEFEGVAVPKKRGLPSLASVVSGFLGLCYCL